MAYFVLIYIHIISSTILFGTGLGSAFYMWRANKTNNYHAMYFAAKNVVIADYVFTTPAVFIQLITGFALAHLMHYPLNSFWLLSALTLYTFVGVCWLPVVWLQSKMRDMLKVAIAENTKLTAKYYRYERIWFYLGWPAFIGVLVIFYLMVFKPVF